MAYIIVKTRDDRVFQGTTAERVVQQMLESNVFTQHKLLHPYMEVVSRRLQMFDNVLIDPTTPDTFLEDLAHHGYITKEQL